MEHSDPACACDGCDLLHKLQASLPNKSSSAKDAELLVLYGSETGNSKSIAEKLQNQALLQNVSVKLHTLDEYEQVGFLDKTFFCAIICSTTGNGDAPIGAEKFTRFVKKRAHAADLLANRVQYSVLALGDTNYDKFCHVGKLIDTRLKAIGATQYQPAVLADEVLGLENFVEPWIQTILARFAPVAIPSLPPTLSTPSTRLEMMVFYGSETGNAKSIAEKLHDAAGKRGIAAGLHTLDEYDAVGMLQSTGFFAIVCSTCGNGDAPLGAERFVRFVKKRTLASDTLQLSYSVLALGDTNYDKFCHVGKTIDTRLRAIGGKQALPLVLADEVLGLETFVEPWIEQVLATVVGKEPLAAITAASASASASAPVGAAEETKPVQHTAKEQASGWAMPEYVETESECNAWTLQELRERTKRLGRIRAPLSLDKILANQSALSFTACSVVRQRKLTTEKSPDRVVMQLVLRPESNKLDWTVGDAIGIKTSNPRALVEACAELLGIFQTPQELFALEHHVDLSTTPDRGFLRTLSAHCKDALDEAKMNYLSSFEGKQAYEALLLAQKLNVVEVLRLFPSCRPANSEVFFGSLMDAPQPRYYSIANSPLAGKAGELEICYSVVRTKMLEGGGRRTVCGVCTNALQGLEEGASVQVFVKPNASFKPPADASVPIIMCGPGTGVAPFIGFIQHREAARREEIARQKLSAPERGAWRGGLDFEDELEEAFALELSITPRAATPAALESVGKSTLYFGCRNAEQDFLYERELNAFLESGALSTLRVAFSRPSTPDSAQKQYVQDLMRIDAAELAQQILFQGAYVFVCGDGTRMARDVQQAICDILAQQMDGGSEERAKEYIADMQKRGRYVQDIW